MDDSDDVQATTPASSRDATLQQKFSVFLERQDTHDSDIKALIAFLDYRPIREQPLNYITDVETRLELVQVISTNLLTLVPNALIWSAIMVAPLDIVRMLSNLPRGIVDSSLATTMAELPLLFKIFLTKNTSEEDYKLYPGLGAKRKALRQKRREKVIKRNPKEVEKCRNRDKYCIVTQAADPQICHIFPFAAKDLIETDTALLSLRSLYADQTFDRIRKLLIVEGEEIIDSAKNMVALEPLLHYWWGKAVIAFEPIAEIKNGIRLRLRWLKTTRFSIRQECALNTDPREVLTQYSIGKDGVVGIQDFRTHRPILDGQIIDIISEDESARPCMEIWSLQWDLLRMASLCGAAEAVADPTWDPEDDNIIKQLSKALGEDSESEYEVEAPTLPLGPRIPQQQIFPSPVGQMGEKIISRTSQVSSPMKTSRASSPTKPKENIRQGSENVYPS